MKVNINVIGLGFVGLTTALGFSEKKFKTIFVEKNIVKLKNIKRGKIFFKKKYLDKILKKNLKKKNIIFSNKIILDKKNKFTFYMCGNSFK